MNESDQAARNAREHHAKSVETLEFAAELTSYQYPVSGDDLACTGAYAVELYDPQTAHLWQLVRS